MALTKWTIGTDKKAQTIVATTEEGTPCNYSYYTRKILNGKAPNNIDMPFYTSARLGVWVIIPYFNYKAQRSTSTAFDDSFGIKAARS